MAQWYAQLLFKGDTLLGDGVSDFAQVEGVGPPNGGERYTTVLVSGYSLYGRLRGYYALGVAHISVDSSTGKSRYLSEESGQHIESLDSLTPAQRLAIREWLIELNAEAWENSTDIFRRSLYTG